MAEFKNIIVGFTNLLTGKETPQEQKRLKICGGCPLLNKKTKRCKECGCYMPAKVKAPAAKCPKNKW